MTVTWRVNYLRVSHKNLFEITKFKYYLYKIYGKYMTVTRGKIHNYLGKYLYYSEKFVMKVSMIKYIDKVLQ